MTELNVLLRTVTRAGEEEVCEKQLGGMWVLGCWTPLQSDHLFHAPASVSLELPCDWAF